MHEPVVIYETVHGSHAYGLARAGSDVDLKGVVVGPLSWYLGWRPAPEQLTLTPDHVRYELRRFFRLAAEANPSVLEVLWVDPSLHRVMTPVGERLVAARDRFLSQRVAERFGRYAQSQLRRIRTHRAWLLSPPSVAPIRGRFGLPEHTVIPADQLAAAETLLVAGNEVAADVSPNFIELLNREKRYKAAQSQWQQYQAWLTNRNRARSELEIRFGYDTKHAMHLVRIQRMALEILETGTVTVHRPDGEELLAIRDGAWTFDVLEAATDVLASRIEAAATSTPLPSEPDTDTLDRLCVELVAEVLW
jgi:uncharacterized protein